MPGGPDVAAVASEPHLTLTGIGKRFGAVRALQDVSLQIARGSIHALVGENGAGKSTLGKIIAGVIAPDHGEISVSGTPVAFRSPREALARGVAVIAQELTIVPTLTVAENVLLGSEPRRGGFLRRRELNRRYDEIAEAAGFALPGDRLASELRTAQQQQVEILRALACEAELIVMDEPTAALSAREADHLHEIIRSLAADARTVVFVSHFLGEVLELSDTITVLRDGRHVQTAPRGGQTHDGLVTAMLGRTLDATFPAKAPPARSQVVLDVRGLSGPGVDDVSLTVRAGEIVGIAGLVGAGRTELARTIYGAAPTLAGEVRLGDGEVLHGGTRARLRAGVAMIPESRKDEGLLLLRSITENASLASLPSYCRGGFVGGRRERRETHRLLDRWEVGAGSYAAAAGTLSGGNQQKVMFARTLLCRPTVLVADEPTRGVDIGSKRAIYDLLTDLVRDGMGVILISSEVEELLGMAHRVVVMRRGRVVTELAGDEMTQAAILAAAFDETEQLAAAS
jgi:rhamnose transport system ATP-binding protein